MLSGDREAVVSSSGKGQTFSNDRYVKEVNGQKFNVFDTAGLGEGSQGIVVSTESIENLYKLISQLDNGVNLLVFVVRGPRILGAVQENYNLFYEKFCNKEVPIVIIITHLENEASMDRWWHENKEVFNQKNMQFKAWACVASSKGRIKNGSYLFQEEYNRSVRKVRWLMGRYSQEPWKMPEVAWYEHVLAAVSRFFGFKWFNLAKPLYEALKEYGGLSDEEAKIQSNRIWANVHGTTA
jgi:hypothetical protein